MMAAASIAGMDVQKAPAYILVNGQFLPIPGKVGVYRGDTMQVFSTTVGDGYNLWQVEQVFDFADTLFGELGAKWVTGGALGDGSKFWGVAKLAGGVETVPGDSLEPYCFFGSSHDGSMGITVIPTIIRVVCKNTFNAALRLGKKRKISFRHTKNLQENIDKARRALGLAMQETENFGEVSKQLASKPATPAQALDMFNVCLDDIVDITVAGQQVTAENLGNGKILEAICNISSISERTKERDRLDKAAAKRENLLKRIVAIQSGETCDGQEGVAGSWWGPVNAVSEFCEHGDKDGAAFRYNGTQQAQFENRLESVLYKRSSDIVSKALDYAVNA
jgi:phage/plasmid-like protein (TIGR03299 family)